MVLAGGVSVLNTPYIHISTSKGEMLSRTGKCRVFDNDADGFIPSEGVGVVVLKSAEKAISDNDYIYGIITGSGVNQDGKTNGITAPSSLSQMKLETEVYRRSGVNPEDISYVEAHGTGTKLGDPIEVSALTKAFQQYTDKRHYCAIGSVKSNIGHTLAASGVSSFVKLAMCLHERMLVPSINYRQANDNID